MIDLGERQKELEEQTNFRLSPGFVIARIDGKGFHKFTRKLNKPFDEALGDCFINTTIELVDRMVALSGYTQSDEISLLFLMQGENDFLGGRIQKLASIIASSATAIFNQERAKYLPNTEMAFFDCRVYNLGKDDVLPYFIWRQKDAVRNSISMASHAVIGHSRTMHKSSRAQLEMLKEAGVDWYSYPARFRRGVFALRVSESVRYGKISDRLPDWHPGKQNPDLTYTRTRIVAEDLNVTEISLERMGVK